MPGKSADWITFHETLAILRYGSKRAELSDSAVQCLILLMEHQDELITKEQIHDACWRSKGVCVSDASIRQVITQIRRAIHSLGITDNVISTYPRKGYMLHTGWITTDCDCAVVPASTLPASPRPRRWSQRQLEMVFVVLLTVLGLFFHWEYQQHRATPKVSYTLLRATFDGKQMILYEVGEPVNLPKEILRSADQPAEIRIMLEPEQLRNALPADPCPVGESSDGTACSTFLLLRREQK